MMKGRHRPSSRSEHARLKIKMFLPVLMALLVIKAQITIMLFTTEGKAKMYKSQGLSKLTN